MSELIITEKKLLEIQEKCDSKLLNLILDEVKVITTQQSNFWDVTTFFRNESKVNLVDKIQVVSLFAMLGGRVELDSHMHDFADWCHLWNYMKEHRYISDDDYVFLCNHWMENGRIVQK